MMDEREINEIRQRALKYFDEAKIALTEDERKNIEVADFGLGEFETTGLVLVTYLNTERVCAKEIVIFPGQTCPEHRHPNLPAGSGKEETFRCRFGTMYLYVDGPATTSPKAHPPEARKEHYTVWHEIILNPGEQYTMQPNTRHWFQCGPEGAIISEFSTASHDESDIFTDPDIVR